MIKLTCKLNERSLPSSKTMTWSKACLSFFSSLSLPNRLRNLLLNLYMMEHGQGTRLLSSSINKTRLPNRPLQNKTVDFTFLDECNLCICCIPLIPNHMSLRDLLVRKGSILVGIVVGILFGSLYYFQNNRPCSRPRSFSL